MRKLLIVWSLLLAAIAFAQTPDDTLRILSPAQDSYVSGTIPLRVQLAPQSGRVRLAIYADGNLVCTLDRAPWECPWDAGDTVAEHQVRAVATLPDGRRVVQTVRTRGVAVTERTDVEAVHVTVTVTDDHGRSVRGLRRDEFTVFDDDVRQHIDYFAGENIPLELVAALDVSGSMADSMTELKRSAGMFLSTLRAGDAVTLLAFNDNIFTLARASTDPTARAKAVDRLAPWGGTALYDVTVKALDLLGHQLGRRAVVIFTDGEDTASRTTLKFVEQRLARSDAVVYTIGQGRGTHVEALQKTLEQIAVRSGGRPFFSDNVEKLSAAFDEILDELSSQYLLTYSPPTAKRDGAWHRIKVQVRDGRYHVRAREGYRAPNAGADAG
jgi:Ca-activated chloride channel family protein